MDISTHFKGPYGTIYYVNDMQKAAAYYKELFNLVPEEESADWTSFNLNGFRICLHSTKDSAQADGKGLLVMNVSNLDGVVGELKSRGVEFTQEIKQVCEGGFAADFQGPGNATISLFEYRG